MRSLTLSKLITWWTLLKISSLWSSRTVSGLYYVCIVLTKYKIVHKFPHKACFLRKEFWHSIIIHVWLFANPFANPRFEYVFEYVPNHLTKLLLDYILVTQDAGSQLLLLAAFYFIRFEEYHSSTNKLFAKTLGPNVPEKTCFWNVRDHLLSPISGSRHRFRASRLSPFNSPWDFTLKQWSNFSPSSN